MRVGLANIKARAIPRALVKFSLDDGRCLALVVVCQSERAPSTCARVTWDFSKEPFSLPHSPQSVLTFSIVSTHPPQKKPVHSVSSWLAYLVLGVGCVVGVNVLVRVAPNFGVGTGRLAGRE